MDDPDVITEPGVYEDLPPDVYHADPTPEGSLSSTRARKLLAPYCPAIYRWEQDNPPEKDAFDFGRAAHRVVLEGEAEIRDSLIVVVESPTWQYKAAKEAKKRAHAEGKSPILAKDWQAILDMAKALAAHPTAAGLFDPDRGRPEQSLFWRDREFGVTRRCRLDFLPHKQAGRRLILPDYKTCAGLPHPDVWRKSAADHGYHQQAAGCLEGVQALGLDEEPAFVFVVQSKQPPYLVTLVELDETALHLGQNLNRIATRVFAECQRSGQWPGYDPGVHLTGLPPWYLRDFDETPEEEV